MPPELDNARDSAWTSELLASETLLGKVAPPAALFRALIEHGADAIALLDRRGGIRYVSPSAGHVLGYQPSEMVGRHTFDLIHPDDQGLLQQLFERLMSDPGGSHAGEFRFHHHDGSWRWIEGTGINLLDEPSVQAIVATYRDLTAQKRREELQRFLAEIGTALTGSLDYAVTLQRVAQLMTPILADWCTVHIIDERGELHRLAADHVDAEKRRLLRELPGTDWSSQPTNPILIALRSGQTRYTPEVTAELLEGDAQDARHLSLLRQLQPRSTVVVPLSARGRPLGVISLVMAESGRSYSVEDVAFIEELARRAALAIDNARLYQEAQRALRAREEFLSIASHELKTPLTTIKGYTQLLQRGLFQEPIDIDRLKQRMTLLLEQTERLEELVLDLLEASHMQQGQVALKRRPSDLTALTRRAIARCVETGEATPAHALRFVGPESVVGYWDPDRLDQVLSNLLSNAVKYSPEGGPIIVALRTADDWAELSVRDAGIGIPPEEQPRLFEPFVRGTSGERIDGTGLGLYITRTIVSQHGGTIAVESAPGSGSTFTVRLPLEATPSGLP